MMFLKRKKMGTFLLETVTAFVLQLCLMNDIIYYFLTCYYVWLSVLLSFTPIHLLIQTNLFQQLL